jgi:hypothetical protein
LGDARFRPFDHAEHTLLRHNLAEKTIFQGDKLWKATPAASQPKTKKAGSHAPAKNW